MKKWILLALAGSLAVQSMAHEGMKAKKSGAREVTLNGQLLDMACYMEEGAKGPKHKDCAAKCVREGAPLGFLSTDGKAYFLVNSHESEAAFQAAKDLTGEDVKLTGTLIEKAGVKAIQVSAVEKSGGAGAVSKSAVKHKKYYCTMDGYESDKAGECPKCGMNLVERK